MGGCCSPGPSRFSDSVLVGCVQASWRQQGTASRVAARHCHSRRTDEVAVAAAAADLGVSAQTSTRHTGSHISVFKRAGDEGKGRGPSASRFVALVLAPSCCACDGYGQKSVHRQRKRDPCVFPCSYSISSRWRPGAGLPQLLAPLPWPLRSSGAPPGRGSRRTRAGVPTSPAPERPSDCNPPAAARRCGSVLQAEPPGARRYCWLPATRE